MRTEAIRMIKAEGQNREDYDIVVDHRDLVLDEHEILVKSGQASVCDADLRYASGMPWPHDLPPFDWPGHEGGGVVTDVGSKVRKVKPGDRVMLFGLDGCWSQYFKSPERNIFKAPDGLTTWLPSWANRSRSGCTASSPQASSLATTSRSAA